MGNLKDIYDIIKDFRSLAKEYKNEEMAEKLIDIQEGFFELREKLAEVQDENRKLKDEIAVLKDTTELEKDLELNERGYLVRKSEMEAKKNIHYCMACWQNHKKLMPIVCTIGGTRQCCNCHTVIG